jgi:hypothetical protein
MVLRTHNLPSGRHTKRHWWSRNDVSRGLKGMRNHFLHPGHLKSGWDEIAFDDLNRRMALRNNILPFERLKMRLRWCRWSDISWFLKAIPTHFVHSGHSKKRLGRSPGSDVLSRRIALRSNNVPSWRLKNYFGEDNEALFQSVELPRELI